MDSPRLIPEDDPESWCGIPEGTIVYEDQNGSWDDVRAWEVLGYVVSRTEGGALKEGCYGTGTDTYYPLKTAQTPLNAPETAEVLDTYENSFRRLESYWHEGAIQGTAAGLPFLWCRPLFGRDRERN